jgi:hypothetical protein
MSDDKVTRPETAPTQRVWFIGSRQERRLAIGKGEFHAGRAAGRHCSNVGELRRLTRGGSALAHVGPCQRRAWMDPWLSGLFCCRPRLLRVIRLFSWSG